MKKIILPTAFLLSLNCQANTNLPDFQMHVFNNEPVPVNHLPAMQMVIFNNDASLQQSAETKGENLLLSHEENGQVSVYSENTPDESEQEIHLEFYLDTGYRQDKLDWTIASPTGTPNILSELSWDNLEIAVVEIGTSLQTPSNWVMDARFAYGTIFDGDNQDSDFFGDNRTDEFSRSNNNADEGSTIDTSISLGYRVKIIPASASFQKPILSFTPKIGFSYHAQNLKITNGKQTIPALGSFGGLDSSYDASWFGPWAGFDSELSLADRFSITTSFEYHYAYYEATANWNLRDDFEHPKSFEHEAEGTGYIASIGSQYKLTNDLSLRLSVDYQKWKADKKGIDTTFFSNGTKGETKFNEVNWESMGANIGIKYAF